MKFFQQIRSLRRLYDHPVELPNGNVLWYRRQAVAETAKRRIAAGLTPPKPSKRLAGFGVGIRKAVDGFDVYLCRAYVDSAKTLEDAVQIWWETEREWFQREQQERRDVEIDAHYWSCITFDKDGYKIFTPRPRDNE